MSREYLTPIKLPTDPGAALEATPKQYVDRSGQFLTAVRAATTTNITNLNSVSTIDSVSLGNGDRVLVKDQTTGSQNGIYTFDAGTLSRSSDADTAAEIPKGIMVRCTNGGTNFGKVYTLTNTVTTVGTDNQNWKLVVQVDAGGSLQYPSPLGTGHMYFDFSNRCLSVYDPSAVTWVRSGHPHVCTSSTRPGFVDDNMVIWETDTQKLMVYYGGTWYPAVPSTGGGSSDAGESYMAQCSGAQTISTTSYTLVAGMSVTVTSPGPTASYLVTFSTDVTTLTTANSIYVSEVHVDGVASGSAQALVRNNVVNARHQVTKRILVTGLAAGSHTIDVRARVSTAGSDYQIQAQHSAMTVERQPGSGFTLGDPVSAIPIRQVFTADGTWTKPANTVYAEVELVGGGGGGGGAATAATDQGAAGGGGGGGAYARKMFLNADLGATEAVVVGAAGAGGAAGANNGTAGGTSSFDVVSCTGGAGGVGMASANNTAVSIGVGGTATGGDINVRGGDGGPGRVIPTGAGDPTAPIPSFGGGSFFYGSTTRPGTATAGAPGVAGTTFGVGGSGGFTRTGTAAQAGGDGFAGVVIVTAYVATSTTITPGVVVAEEGSNVLTTATRLNVVHKRITASDAGSGTALLTEVTPYFGRISKSGTVAVTSGVSLVSCTFAVTDENVGNIVDIANSRFLIPTGGAGLYGITFTATWENSVTAGQRAAVIRAPGSTAVAGALSPGSALAAANTQTAYAQVRLAAADAVTFMVAQNSASNVNLTNAAGGTHAEIVWLGP